MRKLLRASRDLAREAYFLLLVPIFWFLVLPSRLLRGLSAAAGERYQFALIRVSNLLVWPLSAHLRQIREASRDLQTYWREYDGVDLDLYAHALQDPDWFRRRRILDVGCGVGRKSYELARRGAGDVVGIDSSRRSIEVARSLAGEVGNLAYLPVQTAELQRTHIGFFDYVVSFTVFEHLENVEGTLFECDRLLKPGGRHVIVFNHYDKYGAHLKEFIHHPWPQLMFPERALFGFWNRELARAHARGEMGYFPGGYVHGHDGHNSDCFMNLNRMTLEEFRRLPGKLGLRIQHELHYSRSPVLRWIPGLEGTRLGRYLQGSVVYVLEKPR